MQTLYNQCATFVQDTNFCTSRVAFIAKNCQFTVQVSQNQCLCKCTQNQFTVQQEYNNQFTVQVYTKPVDHTSVHNTSFLGNNERNVHGRNITKVRQCEVYTKQVVCTSVYKTSLLINNVHKTSLVMFHPCTFLSIVCPCTFLSLLARYTCTVNWFCVHLYSKLFLCTLVQETGFVYTCIVNWFCVN